LNHPSTKPHQVDDNKQLICTGKNCKINSTK
jgi:hypothetical protein